MGSLELDAVRKEFADTVALDGVSLDIAEGEFFTLVGPSGCGKTTTLRTIAGLETPTSGSVRFDGVDVSGVPTEERDVGIVFQNYALFPHMSVRENVAYGLNFVEPPDGKSTDERVTELLDLVDLSGMGDREPDQLSGGQQQRVALARALAPAPDVLLLDEPMSALDARLRETLRRQVKRIQAELDVTTVYVTHDQEEALAISDRLAVMHDGRVEQVGTPREVYERPATEFVAAFVGENNLFRGEAVGTRDDGTTTVAVDGTEFRVADGDLAAGDLTFCVRPEDLTVDADTNRFEVTVDTVEFLGETTRYYVDWGEKSIVFRTPDPHDAERLTLGFDPGDARVL
ncbi:ABC transporter ATP-binding protein [Halosimplex salinum]|uniref:ABC transporter ATP-binding protein n=1 Tax=Halosimplex salinum TaxID=1710538 RepID=UPI000F496606